jgi:hypothetical protein
MKEIEYKQCQLFSGLDREISREHDLQDMQDLHDLHDLNADWFSPGIKGVLKYHNANNIL